MNMENIRIKLADAKAHLSQLAERAAAGETVIVTKRGKPVMRLTQAKTPRKPVNFDMLQHLTRTLPPQTEDAGLLMRRARDAARY